MSVADKVTQATKMREIIAVPSVGDHAAHGIAREAYAPRHLLLDLIRSVHDRLRKRGQVPGNSPPAATAVAIANAA